MQGPLRNPRGLSLDFEGRLYVAEAGAGRIAVFSPEGEFVSRMGSQGIGERRFLVPTDVCASRSFTLLVADSESDRAQVFDLMGNFAGYQPALEGELSRPWGLDLGFDNHLYIVDRDNHTVLVVDPDGTIVDRLGSLGSGSAQLRDPTFVSVGDNGIAVSDTGNRRIQLFDLNGSYAGELRGDLIPGGFDTPAGVELGLDGVVFVADGGSARIVALDRSGRVLGMAGRGAGDGDGPLVPSGVAFGRENRLFVADQEGGLIYVYRIRYDPDAMAPDASPETR
jgi:DNA-binding beta-propeller fold protein YncE